MAIKTGTAGKDKIYGTQWNDTLRGGGNNDYLNGQGGNDTLFGDAGEDKVDGGAGNDTLYGGSGRDFLIGGAGNDIVHGEDGNDYIMGGSGFDRLHGGAGDDRLLGGAGTNEVHGDAGNDTIVIEEYGTAQAGASKWSGGSGTDTLHFIAPGKILTHPDGPETSPIAVHVKMGADGTGTVNYLAGFVEISNEERQGTFTGIEAVTVGAGTSLQYGGGEADVKVTGGAGTDVFWLGGGDEILTGGAGRDYFNIDADWVGKSGNLGKDVITDFKLGTDVFTVLDLPPEEGFVFHQSEKNGDTHVTANAPDGHQVLDLTLLGVTGLPDIQATSNDWWG